MRFRLPRLRGWRRFLAGYLEQRKFNQTKLGDINGLLLSENQSDERTLKVYVVLLAILPIVQGLLLGAILHQLQVNQNDLASLPWTWLPILALAYVVLLVAEPFLTIRQGYMIEKLARYLVPKSRSLIGAKLLTLDRGTYEARQTQETVTKVSEGAHRLLDSWRQALFFRQCLIKLGAALLTLVFINWVMCLIITICALPLLLISMRYAASMWRLSQQQRGGWRKYWHLIYYLRNKEHVRDFRLHGLGDTTLARLEQLYSHLNGQQERLQRAYLPYQQGASMLVYLAAGVAFVWCMVSQLWIGVIAFGSLSIAISSLLAFNGALAQAVNAFGQLQQNSLFVGDFVDFLKLIPAIVLPENPVKPERKDGFAISFEDVWFQYPLDPEDEARSEGKTEDKWVLKGLTLTIKAGDRIALVAKNGGGKSTLLSLLLREYDPQKGRILINGVDLRELDLDAWYSYLAVMVQGLEPMYLPVGEQIMLADPKQAYDFDRDLPRLERAGDLSRAREVIEKWKHRWHSRIGRDFKQGEVPSGGEEQRLVNTRMFNRNADIYLLDEPTSAIDVEAGRSIIDNYFSAPAGKTVILISHAFSNVVKASRIVVLSDGKIAEDGGHDELLAKNGLYASLYHQEAKVFLPRGESQAPDA